MIAILVVGSIAIGMPIAASAATTSGARPSVPALGYSAADPGSLNAIARIVGAGDLWSAGITGRGIGVAVIDTGVTRVPGLAAAGQVIDGPDLSFDSQTPALAHLDSYGHGTHMAGIVAGRDPAAGSSPATLKDPNSFVGIAPDAHIINVKVGASDGAADVSQVIAAIDWVVQHRNDPGLNIKVLSLSYGTNATQPYQIDPLAYAAEVAWRNGIVVVASGGNDGRAVPALANPGFDPTLIAVGSDDPMGTLERLDDTVPAFATHGTAARPVDVIAPGVSVISLRVPGSYVDTTYPGGTVGTRFQRGSGTSQSTAVVAGLVALLRQRFPDATPDQIKSLLTGSAYRINANLLFAGKGIVDGGAATLLGIQTLTSLVGVTKPLVGPAAATGIGSLEASRGDSHVVSDGATPLVGERDIFGMPFAAPTMATAEARLASWTGGTWNGSQWTGATWSSGSWPTFVWTGTDWAGSRWKGSRWKDAAWDGSRWKNVDWSSSGWSGSRWKDSGWAGSRWR
ncbi:MAG: S8 family serine peptidase [Acidimicrobiia bacterium]